MMRRYWICAAVLFTISTAATGVDLDQGVIDYGRRDYAAAIKEFRPLAEQGNAAAQNDLGNAYAEGHGVARDYVQAAKWYRKAAEQGDAAGETNLGNMYAAGKGVPRNDTEAVNWYRKAADQGFAGGEYRLGMMYKKGL